MPLYFKKTIFNDVKIVVWRRNESLEQLLDVVKLSDADKISFEKISVQEKKEEFLAGKYALEQACEVLNIEYYGIEKDEHGKPHLVGKEYEISLTHTEDFIATVFSKSKPVGIDLEKPRKQILRVLPRLFTELEVATVNENLEKATVYWSVKEALYKLYGKRSVDFKKDLMITEKNDELLGTISINDQITHHKIYIEKVESYFLIVAY